MFRCNWMTHEAILPLLPSPISLTPHPPTPLRSSLHMPPPPTLPRQCCQRTRREEWPRLTSVTPTPTASHR
jgi:hypothetical protein